MGQLPRRNDDGTCPHMKLHPTFGAKGEQCAIMVRCMECGRVWQMELKRIPTRRGLPIDEGDDGGDDAA